LERTNGAEFTDDSDLKERTIRSEILVDRLSEKNGASTLSSSCPPMGERRRIMRNHACVWMELELRADGVRSDGIVGRVSGPTMRHSLSGTFRNVG